MAVSGAQSIEGFAPKVDHLIAVEPEADLISTWDKAVEGRESRKIGQLPICWDPDRERAVERAHEQFRWFGGGWKVNAELPGPSGFAGATQFVLSTSNVTGTVGTAITSVAFTVTGAVPEVGVTERLATGACPAAVNVAPFDIWFLSDDFPTAFTYSV